MAHIEKYSRQDLRKVLKETYREWDDPDKYENEVDLSRSHLNYNMNPNIKWTPLQDKVCSDTFMHYLEDRVTDLIMNTMGGQPPKLPPKFVSWVMTLPKPLQGDDAKSKLFFEEFYKFCQERYGKDNVIDGVVHNDETSPHMTVYIVPECISRKSGKPTISAATRFQRNELRMFHSDFDKVCEKLFGQANLVVRSEEERLADPKNLTLREYKVSKAMEEANAKAQQIVEAAQKKADELIRQAKQTQQDFDDTERQKITMVMNQATQKIRSLKQQIIMMSETIPVISVDDAKVLSAVNEQDGRWKYLDDYEHNHWNDDMDTPLVKKVKACVRQLPDISNIKSTLNDEYQL